MTGLSRRRILALAGTAPFLRAAAADHTLRISEGNVELSRGHTVRTTLYNGQVPGPLLRMKEGRLTTVEVINETRDPEMVHWHGFHIPPEVDGSHEEGTPMVQGHDRRSYSFIPAPSGTRWYHTHAMAGHNLRIGSYSGQFGMAIVEPKEDPGRYDVEIPILLHEFEPYFSSASDMDLAYRLFTVNGKMLGAGEPVRVRAGQKALFRIVNASATLEHNIALAGHTFRVVALDGNPVAAPQTVPVLRLAPGERVDAIVDMSRSGVWILGEVDAKQRAAGAGIVVEYAGASGKAQWAVPPSAFRWDYSLFGTAADAPNAEVTIPLVIEPGKDGNLWAINGKSWPNTDEIRLRQGQRNRLVLENRADMDHPVHLHRHSFELVRVGGKAMTGVFKDVVLVPARQTVEVDVAEVAPGPSLFHCHQQFHMDFGFMALMRAG